MTFKAPLTASYVSQFLDSFQSFEPIPNSDSVPYVYVDQQQVRFVTNVIQSADNTDKNDIFALSVGESGWVELLALESDNKDQT